MAFGGNMGAAAAMIPVAAMSVPRGSGVPVYSGTSLTVPSADGTGTVPTQIQELVVRPTTSGSVALAAFVGQSLTGATADAGCLVSAAPAANQHGIPSNFGPGRGRWVDADIYRLRVMIEAFQFTAGTYIANSAAPFCSFVQLALSPGPSDILIFFKNISSLDVSFMRILLRYEHSIAI